MIVDGRAIAADILSSVRAEVSQLPKELVVRAVVMKPNAATESYLKIKAARAEEAGMRMEVVQMPGDAVTEDLLAAVTAPGADAVIVQLPLPELINTELVLDEIPLEKDADVLSRFAYEHFIYQKEGFVPPPVVAAVKEVLERGNVSVEGKRVVIVGGGRLVGQPVAAWIEREGADMVTIITRESGDKSQLPFADIIISGAGSPHLITPEDIKEGVVLIDAGTSESKGSIVGDIDPACAEKASLYTPVPGGIGPIAVACLFQNVAILARTAHLRNT